MKRKYVLLADAMINCILGILLLFFSERIVTLLGVPNTDHYFYPNILGGVLFGIGIALLIEIFRKNSRFIGLGLGGAIAINISGGCVLAGWLISNKLDIPGGGRVFLWVLVCVLIGISCTEWIIHRKSMHIQD